VSIGFEGKTVVVTGGATGIGRACVQLYAAAGARVVIGDIARERAEQLVEELASKGADAAFVATDVSSSAACAALVQQARERFGSIDVLHANAGVELCKSLLDTSDLDWRHVLGTNLDGVFYCCREAMRMMRVQARGGSLVMTASPLAFTALRDIGAYAAAKGGVVALMRAFALEGAPHGIRANAVIPGTTDTPMLRREVEAASDPEGTLALWAQSVPMGRLVQPADVAQAAFFLASDSASFVTGSCVVVDGGQLATFNTGPIYAYTD